jgi:hypothetical protein
METEGVEDDVRLAIPVYVYDSTAEDGPPDAVSDFRWQLEEGRVRGIEVVADEEVSTAELVRVIRCPVLHGLTLLSD